MRGGPGMWLAELWPGRLGWPGRLPLEHPRLPAAVFAPPCRPPLPLPSPSPPGFWRTNSAGSGTRFSSPCASAAEAALRPPGFWASAAPRFGGKCRLWAYWRGRNRPSDTSFHPQNILFHPGIPAPSSGIPPNLFSTKRHSFVCVIQIHFIKFCPSIADFPLAICPPSPYNEIIRYPETRQFHTHII